MTFYTQEPQSNLMVVEVLDVKQVSWPEPSDKVCLAFLHTLVGETHLHLLHRNGR